MDWHDGRQISDLMRSRKMDGIGSQVLIDDSGNRYGDYSLLAMVENDDQQFKFKVIHNFSRNYRNYLLEYYARLYLRVIDLKIWFSFSLT